MTTKGEHLLFGRVGCRKWVRDQRRAASSRSSCLDVGAKLGEIQLRWEACVGNIWVGFYHLNEEASAHQRAGRSTKVQPVVTAQEDTEVGMVTSKIGETRMRKGPALQPKE